MKAPDKIFLSVEKGEDWAHAMWTQKDPKEQKFSELDEHKEYIRKDAILEWARKEANKSFNSFAREELGMEAREKGLAFERLIKHIESL